MDVEATEGGSQIIERDEFAIRIETTLEATYLSLYGELDLATADVFESALGDVEDGDAERIVVDLSGLSFIDSTGLATLIEAEKRSRLDSSRLAFLRGPGHVQRLFKLTQVEDFLPFAD